MNKEQLKIEQLKQLVEQYMNASDKDALIIAQLKQKEVDIQKRLDEQTSKLSECVEMLSNCRKDREQLIQRIELSRTGNEQTKLNQEAVFYKKYMDLVEDSKKLLELQSLYTHSFRMKDKQDFERFKVNYKIKLYKA